MLVGCSSVVVDIHKTILEEDYKVKNYEVKFDKNDELMNSISLKDIDMRPSAPWIQKGKKGIVFTSDILKDSIDLKSEKSRKGMRKKQDSRYKDDEST